ncbi:L-sorbose 1-dehydrogenase-like [Argiope bruennichi]|uniref:L-sorbose 1-dehydrogenase-like n=1 Tax=Argiope bruennichi TaxID=94029 RepID=UPI0024957EA9|nr:L-sorbose 1-dehydrogenase-like [Argiope bruennichi]
MFFDSIGPDVTRALLHLYFITFPYVPYQPEVSNYFDEEYDYIIVGGGSAGSVLASRLSEDPCVKILLLEAGGDVDSLTEIPVAAFLTQLTDNDWKYLSAPQINAGGGYPTRRFPVPRGKGLGGSSLLNCMLYVRGCKADYDNWAQNGATGWSWDDVYPYFLKAENNTDPEIANNGYHSTSGYLTVSTPPENNAFKDAIAASAQEVGYEYRDINGERHTGFAKVQGTIRDGRRCSTAKAYLVPAENRDNLHIVNEAFVLKVLINKNKEAYGVRFKKDGDVYDIRARKEVIMSAGSINSPQILMLSGIGPRAHLENLGIKVIADLPVGNNLHDHVGNIMLNFEAEHAKPTFLRRAMSPSNLFAYRFKETGADISLSGVEGMAFLNTKYNEESNLDWPDVQIHFVSGSPATDFTQSFKESVGMPEEVYEKVYVPYLGKNTFTFFPVLLRPKSRGTLRLNSTNPDEYPLIDFNLFDDESDLDKVVDVMKQCINLVTNTNAFKKIGAKMFTIKAPACEEHEIYSDEYLRCVARNYPFNIYHPSGTCKMGAAGDDTTVVDPQLKVKGIKNLRVIDASVLPNIPTGNTNAPVIMIAEKASDMIKNDNPDRTRCFRGDDARIKRNRWKRK